MFSSYNVNVTVWLVHKRLLFRSFLPDRLIGALDFENHRLLNTDPDFRVAYCDNTRNVILDERTSATVVASTGMKMLDSEMRLNNHLTQLMTRPREHKLTIGSNGEDIIMIFGNCRKSHANRRSSTLRYSATLLDRKKFVSPVIFRSNTVRTGLTGK